jgi:hypothetical protein
MDTLVPILITAAWIAIFAVLLSGVLNGWRHALRTDESPFPFFRLLERNGLTLAAAEAAVGIRELAHAAGRCTTCASRRACEAGGFPFTRPAGCPNERLFERLESRRTA